MKRCEPRQRWRSGSLIAFWTIGDLLDAALATLPIKPTTSAPDRRRRFRVIEGGRN
jgi:hypothetical protein